MRKEFIVKTDHNGYSDNRTGLGLGMDNALGNPKNASIHISCTVAEKGYRIVEQWEKKKYLVPECAMHYNEYKKEWDNPIIGSKFSNVIIYEIPEDFEFELKEEYYYITEADKDEFEKPEFAEWFTTYTTWEPACRKTGFSAKHKYRIPLSRKSELVSKWVTPTDEDVVKYGRLECQVKNNKDGEWEQGQELIGVVKNGFITLYGKYKYCRVLRSALREV